MRAREENGDMKINIKELASDTGILKAGRQIYLSGTVYTARDAAHAKLVEMLERGEKPPFKLAGCAIYY